MRVGRVAVAAIVGFAIGLAGVAEQSAAATTRPTSVSPSSSVWGVSAAHSIYRYVGSGNWARVAGSLTQVAVSGSGVAWGVNASHSVYRYAGSGRWDRLPGALAEVAVGSNDTAWGVNDSGAIYRFDANRWIRIDGSLRHISVGGDGNAWGVTKTGAVYRYNDGWKKVPGSLSRLAAGGDGGAWGVNSWHAVYRFIGPGAWQRMPGELSTVAAGGDGNAWGINANHAIYQFSAGRWNRMPGALTQIAVGGRVDTLPTGAELRAGGALWSADGRYRLVMQRDGNLVVYGPSGASWQSGSSGTGDNAFLRVQGDGNVVVYTATQSPTWASGTNGSQNDRLTIQSDGNLVVYSNHGAVWSSYGIHSLGAGVALGTGGSLFSPSGRYRALMQTDGNFVVYGPAGALWSSRTSGSNNWIIMQSDGNLVVYSADNRALWASGTGSPGSYLQMQDDSNLVVYTRDGHAAWASNAQSPGAPGGVLGDDYPSNLKNAAKDSLFDPWRFYNRECTSFVAWRLNNVNHVGFNDYYKGPQWGDASNWGAAAQSVGIALNDTPARGAVAWRAGGDHVAWVAEVNSNGTVTIEEYNYDYQGHYNTRTVPASTFRYIHVQDI